MQPDRPRTPGIRLRRGVGAGMLAALGAGAVVVLFFCFAALPWSVTGLGGYRLVRGMTLLGAVAFGFVRVVVAACERAGGMRSAVFDVVAVCWTILLGIVLMKVALIQAERLAGKYPSVLEAGLLVIVPCLAGACLSLALRRSTA